MKVAVLHDEINAGGGADAVLANTLQAVQDEHDTTLFTITDHDIPKLNRYHGTSVDPSKITVRDPLPKPLSTSVGLIEQLMVRALPISKLKLLKSSLLKWSVNRMETGHDIYICTQCEFVTQSPSIQYIHFPRLSQTAASRYTDESLLQRFNRVISTAIHPVPPEFPPNTTTLTNSEWTSGVIKEAYGIDAIVVYPPIETESFDPQPWAQREEGCVAVGRIVPSKRYEVLIHAMDELRERGQDCHLHIVGALNDNAYCDKIRSMAADRSHVSLEGGVDREELCGLLESHKYGLHAKRAEHFGMVVAEMCAAGMIPFVHRSGGQVEIVGRSDHLTYLNTEDLVDRLQRVMSDTKRQRQLLKGLTDKGHSYNAERFRERITELVAEQSVSVTPSD